MAVVVVAVVVGGAVINVNVNCIGDAFLCVSIGGCGGPLSINRYVDLHNRFC